MLTQFRRILIKLKTNLWKRENVTKDSEDEDVWAALEGPGWYDIWGIHSTYVQPAIHMPDVEVTDKSHPSSFLGCSQGHTSGIANEIQKD